MRFTRICRGIHADIVKQIRFSGPMPIASFMQLSLANPRDGYYMTKENTITPEGDFITSPEIHQMFGELVGAWILREWSIAGSPNQFEYLELGPGRGTLARDVVNTISLLLSKMDRDDVECNLSLLEISPILSKLQAKTLGATVTDVLSDNDGGPYMTAVKDNIKIKWFRFWVYN